MFKINYIDMYVVVQRGCTSVAYFSLRVRPWLEDEDAKEALT